MAAQGDVTTICRGTACMNFRVSVPCHAYLFVCIIVTFLNCCQFGEEVGVGRPGVGGMANK